MADIGDVGPAAGWHYTAPATGEHGAWPEQHSESSSESEEGPPPAELPQEYVHSYIDRMNDWVDAYMNYMHMRADPTERENWNDGAIRDYLRARYLVHMQELMHAPEMQGVPWDTDQFQLRMTILIHTWVNVDFPDFPYMPVELRIHP